MAVITRHILKLCTTSGGGVQQVMTKHRGCGLESAHSGCSDIANAQQILVRWQNPHSSTKHEHGALQAQGAPRGAVLHRLEGCQSAHAVRVY